MILALFLIAIFIIACVIIFLAFKSRYSNLFSFENLKEKTADKIITLTNNETRTLLEINKNYTNVFAIIPPYDNK